MTLDPQNSMTRRRVLSGVVVAGAAAPILAACGGDEPAPSAPTTEETTASSDEPTPEDSASAEPSPDDSESADAGGGGEAVAKTADVPVGGGTVNKEAHVVVTQPTEGDFKGFTSICTHKGCDVSSVADGTIHCRCHGSMFSATTGEVTGGGKATAPLAAIAVKVNGADIVKV